MKKILLILLSIPLFAQGQIITTYAGTGSGGYDGDNIPAVTAEINMPAGVVTDASGNIYFTDFLNERVRKVDADGIITTIAGNGVPGSDSSGMADTAELYLPSGIAVDDPGNVYFSSAGHLLKVSPSGVMANVAGGGNTILASGVAANLAELGQIRGIAIDRFGNIYFSDTYHNRICKVDTAGIITTIAGTGNAGYSGDGGQAVNAELNEPYGVAVDFSGNIYFDDYGNARIRAIYTSGIINTIAGTGAPGNSGDGGLAISAQLYSPSCIALDNLGDIYIGDSYNANIRMVNSAGMITTIAGRGVSGYSGDGGPADSAELNSPYGVTVDHSGYVYIADYGNSRIRQIGLATGVNNVQKGKYVPIAIGMQIFPNPATSSLTITSTENITNITITNLIGQPVYNQSCNSEKAQLDISGLPGGVYFVKANGTMTRTFVKE